MSYDVLHSGCNPSDHSVILAKFAIDLNAHYNYSILCAHIMCTYYVHILCAHIMCTYYVHILCAHIMCTYAHIMCTYYVHILCAHIMCTRVPGNTEQIVWDKVSAHEIHNYKCTLDTSLSNISLPLDALYCTDVFCTSHASSIETFHNDIVNVCMSASKSTIPTTSTHTRSRGRIVGWNDRC